MNKFAYFGTPYYSAFVLDELKANGFVPTTIITTPDKAAGRGLTLVSSPVKKWAEANGIPLLQPETFDADTIATLTALECDFFIVAAYGKILPQAVLDIHLKGNLNVHPSLLPRYRGTSPIESQILADEKEVGVSVILMDAQVDHGPIVAQKVVVNPDWPTSRNVLTDRLWRAGGTLLAETLPAWNEGTVVPKEQRHSDATFTKKMDKEDGEIKLDGPARENYLKYLAYEGWPGTFFFIEKSGKQIRVKIVKASFENGKFIPERVIPEGKKEMSYADFIR